MLSESSTTQKYYDVVTSKEQNINNKNPKRNRNMRKSINNNRRLALWKSHSGHIPS